MFRNYAIMASKGSGYVHTSDFSPEKKEKIRQVGHKFASSHTSTTGYAPLQLREALSDVLEEVPEDDDHYYIRWLIGKPS